LVSGLWAGLSGKSSYYFGATALQVIVPALLLLVAAIWSDAIDLEIKRHPGLVKTVMLRALGWVLALMVVAKVWFSAFSWKQISPSHTRKYLVIWSAATIGFITLALFSRLPADPYRVEHFGILAAFLIFPLARLGLAPGSLAKNRHR
jgi:hypothetical protein